MVSDFRKRKLTRGFEFFDTDKSGEVELADFELAAKKIQEKSGKSADDAKIKQLKAFLTNLWEGIQKDADSDNDGKITLDEWIKVWSNFSTEAGSWQMKSAKFLFDTLDAGGDGVITADEFTKVTVSFGRPKEETEVAFQKASSGKSSINFDDFVALYKEYYTTDDPNAPGNYIFGRTNFD